MGEDDDFDVEHWERLLRVTVVAPTDRSRPDIVEFDTAEPDLDVDPFSETSAEVLEPGFPSFEHGQWTVEGELERFGAFGRGASRAVGWKRVVAIVLVAAIVAPILIVALVNLVRVIR